MKVTICGTEYECRNATKENDKVTLYLGEYDEYGNERTSIFINFQDGDIVGIEDVTEPAQPSNEERIAELEEALDLLLSGVTE